jgi:hypothetical protein
VLKRLIRLVALIQHLADTDVRLGRVEGRRLGALGGELQVLLEGPQRAVSDPRARCALPSVMEEHSRGW